MYKPIKFIEPLIQFIKRCPFLNSAEIDVMTFKPDSLTEGNALTYEGTGKSAVKYDALGGVTLTKQANFILFIRRPINDEVYKLEAADFLCNFESWVEYENFMGDPVRFGDTEHERIWADNGALYDMPEEADVMDFAVQIHVEYQVVYENE